MGVAIRGRHANEHFELLKQDQAAIESEFGEELKWEEMLNRKRCRIVVYREGIEPENREAWPVHLEWLHQKLEKFNFVFRQRIRNLDITDYEPDDQEAE